MRVPATASAVAFGSTPDSLLPTSYHRGNTQRCGQTFIAVDYRNNLGDEFRPVSHHHWMSFNGAVSSDCQHSGGEQRTTPVGALFKPVHSDRLVSKIMQLGRNKAADRQYPQTLHFSRPPAMSSLGQSVQSLGVPLCRRKLTLGWRVAKTVI